MRYVVFGILFLVSLLSWSQADSAFVLLSPKDLPPFKKMTEVSTIIWNPGTKGLKSLTLSFNEGDTVAYTISRQYKREARFSLLDYNAPLIDEVFDKGVNIVSGGFTVKSQRTFIFMIKNHSLLGNDFTLDIKKTVFVPPVITPPPVPVKYVYVDSMSTLMDTTIYLACTLNLNQPNNFFVKIDHTKEYDLAIMRDVNITLEKSKDDLSKKTVPQALVTSCNGAVPVNTAQGSCIMYLYVYDGNTHFQDSLSKTLLKEEQYCTTHLNANTESYLLLSNSDKVVGKYVHVRLVEVERLKKVSKDKSQ